MRESPIGKDTYTGWIVTGAFQRPIDARGAVDQLRAAHFTPADVGVLLPAEAGSPPAAGSDAAWPGSGRPCDLGGPDRIKLAGMLEEAAGNGASSGPDGLAATLVALGIQPDHAAWYAEKAGQGFALVVVRAGTREVEARRIMHEFGSRETPPTQREPSTPAGFALSVKDAVTQPAGADPVQPRAGWQVLGSDQRPIGSVDAVGPTYLLIRGGGREASHLFVPFSAVARIEVGKVYLDVPSDAVGDHNWSAEPGVGDGANSLTEETYHPAGVPESTADLPDARSARPPGEVKG